MLAACGGGGSDPFFQLLSEGPPASGFGAVTVNVPFQASATRDLTLAAGIAVTGVVTDGLGAPLNNVSVSFHSRDSSPPLDRTTTNGTGDYSLTVGEGTWIAELDDPILGTMTVSDVVVAAPGPVTVNFQFAATVAITGTISEAFGPAIASAQVDFTGSQTGMSVSLTCDLSGVYTTALVPDT